MMPRKIRESLMTEPQAAIRASRVSKAFGGRPVLVDLDLEIAAGVSVALTGANGAGKTTLLNCLASVLRPDAGEVRWFGRLVGRDVALHRSIGMVAHESGLYAHLSLRENLLLAARLNGVDNSRRRADHWLDITGLSPHADALPTRLSRGMRQRLALARALIHDPPLLLLDEPFTCLDASGAEWLATLLIELRDRGRTICFVSHEQEEIRRLAHRVIELREGKVYDVTATHECQGTVPIFAARRMLWRGAA
jgi:ABC-type multidrug transport system ATPase subunit